MTQPEALRLADHLEREYYVPAAYELRRLYSVNQELLEALKDAAECIESWGEYASDYFQDKHDLAGDVNRIRAVIAKAEGKT